jgi:hypothetical protein
MKLTLIVNQRTKFISNLCWVPTGYSTLPCFEDLKSLSSRVNLCASMFSIFNEVGQVIFEHFAHFIVLHQYWTVSSVHVNLLGGEIRYLKKLTVRCWVSIARSNQIEIFWLRHQREHFWVDAKLFGKTSLLLWILDWILAYVSWHNLIIIIYEFLD